MRNIVKWQIIALIGVFVISSCATSNDVVSGHLITKRKYNKGFHLNLNKSYNTAKSLKQADEVENEASILVESEIETTQNEVNTSYSTVTMEENAQAQASNSIDFIADSPKEEVNISEKIIREEQTKPISQKAKKIIKFVEKTKEKESSSKGSDSDIKLVLLVILAFIISPLAMYLADGQTDIWFILDLILYLLWFSIFFVGNLYLTGLAAVVIALLRIFGAI